MGKHIKYTKELLEPLVENSKSVSEILKKLGLNPSGGSHKHVSLKIQKYGIDSSHFLGQASNCGKSRKGGTKKKEWQEILVERHEGYRQESYRLRRALIESGRQYICEKCDTGPIWNNEELRIQVDHKDGNWLNDKEDNLRLLCPNCHSQTKNFCGSTGFSELTSKSKYQKSRRRKRTE